MLTPHPFRFFNLLLHDVESRCFEVFELERHSWQALFLLLDLPAAGANPNPSTSPVFHLYTAQVASYLLHLALALLDVTVFRTLVVFVSAPWIVSARPFNNLTSLPRTIPSAHTTRLFTCRSPAMPGLEMAPLVADDMRGMLPRLRPSLALVSAVASVCYQDSHIRVHGCPL